MIDDVTLGVFLEGAGGAGRGRAAGRRAGNSRLAPLSSLASASGFIESGETGDVLASRPGAHGSFKCDALMDDILMHAAKLAVWESQLADCEAFWGDLSWLMCASTRLQRDKEVDALDDAADEFWARCLGSGAFDPDDLPSI